MQFVVMSSRRGEPRPGGVAPSCLGTQRCSGTALLRLLAGNPEHGLPSGLGGRLWRLAWYQCTAYSELEGTHRDHRVQPLSEWPVRGCFSSGASSRGRVAGRGAQLPPRPSCPGQEGQTGGWWSGMGLDHPAPLIHGADVSPTRLPALDLSAFMFSALFSSAGCWSQSGNARDFMMHRKFLLSSPPAPPAEALASC